MIVGKINIQQEESKGWLVGRFLPEGPFKDDNVEIYYKKLDKDNFEDKLHYHPVGKEYLIVISGKIEMQIGDEIAILTEGDYVAINQGQKDKIIKVIENTVICGLRYPSVADNKVMLE